MKIKIGFRAKREVKPYLLPSTIHPLLVLPGVLGSWPPRFSPQGKLDPLTHAYANLQRGLQNVGYRPGLTLFPFPYDWRMSVRQIALKLQAEIARIKKLPAAPGVDYSKVDLLCHSMGGLVARTYIQSDSYAADVNKLLMVATPHGGALAAYPAWEAGDSTWIGVPIVAAQALAQMTLFTEAASVRQKGTLLYQTVRRQSLPDLRRYIQEDLPTIRELLPLGQQNYLYSLDEENREIVYPFGKPENPLLEELNQPAMLERLSRPAEVICLYSSSEKTPVRLKVSASTVLPSYEHGQPTASQPAENYQPGDGVVPAFSARLESATNENLTQLLISNLNHVQIVGDPAPVRRILDYFVRPEARPITEAVFDGPLLATMKPNLTGLFFQ